MSERIKKIFETKNKKLVTFTTGGDPDLNTSLEILKTIINNGIDIIEIGMPFSDPMADGPTIQESSVRSLANGTKINDIFELVMNIRKFNNEIPIILMGYYNSIFNLGINNFTAKCAKTGVDGLIIVDLPPEEDNELCVFCLNHNLHFIRLLTPTSDNQRLPALLNNSSGFLYYVSVAGVTGTKVPVKQIVANEIDRIKRHTDLPVCVGFGIKTPEDASAISTVADGVVVGSAIIETIQKGASDSDVFAFISSLSKSIHLE